MAKGNRVEAGDFVAIARKVKAENKTLADLVALTGLQTATVKQRLKKLGERGVKGLPTFAGQRGGNRLNVDKLNEGYVEPAAEAETAETGTETVAETGENIAEAIAEGALAAV